ncbi:hypothetical protein [Paucilactobacillus nenjiangensis]|jgi:Arc/MetJ-type ribon-helix-helix transcriptional regulator|nr:hypothetical protein [Paucilactobacillus nenjiangensis]
MKMGVNNMSVDIPQNMDEVAMNLARENRAGHNYSEDEVIKKAVLESLQAYTDEETEGHYDTVAWDGENMVVTDIMKAKMGQVEPVGANFIEDFRKDAMGLMFKLESAAAKITHGR